MDFSSIFGIAGGAINFGLGMMAQESERSAFQEKQRREQQGFDKLAGEIQSRGGAASGLSSESASLQNYLAGITSEFKRQQNWAWSDFHAAQTAKSMGSFVEALTGVGSSVLKGMGSLDSGGGMGSGGSVFGGLDHGSPGPGGSYYSSILGGFKLED